MTLQECKDQVAKEHGFDNWAAWRKANFGMIAIINPESPYNEAAELYARSKWEEACKKQIKNCYQAYMRTPVAISANKFECITEEMNAIKKASKPEFKP